MTEIIKPIYHNMDKLEVTFQGAFPLNLIEFLIETKEEAQASKKFIPLELGKNKEIYKIWPTGLGGFSLGLVTADDGIQISTQKSDDKDLWNIFVGVRSWYLALNGYEVSKDRVLRILDDLGAKTNTRTCPYTGEVTTRPLESIRRIDYCFDFRLTNFIPSEDNVIYHQSGKIKEEGFFVKNKRGTKINALTMGSRGNRELQIYDKILEIKTKNNEHWYDIWGLEPDERKDIWRVECRFFKNYIRRHDLRTFYDLERNLAVQLKKTFTTIKYVMPNDDSNRSRWPVVDFWERVKATAIEALKYQGCDVLPESVHEAKRKRSLDAIEKMTTGICITQAVLSGVSFNNILDIPKRIESDIKQLLKYNPELLKKKYDEAHQRYFVDKAL